MSIVTLQFIIFLFISVLIYYIFPKKIRYLILLISSMIFFILASGFKLAIYLFVGVIATYILTNLMAKEENKMKKNIFLTINLLVVIGILSTLKYINIFPVSINTFGRLFNINLNFTTFNFLAPIGISYYSLSLISYILDTYWQVIKPTKNIFKLLLFSSYYPTLVSGPVIRYKEVEQELFNTNSLDWNNIYTGFYRLIYGLMKKLVIADFLATYVSIIFNDYKLYSGYYIIFGVIFYAIQIYMDFSGCMDIVLGASKMYGVNLPENFNSPFFSRSLSEFWRKWHITLGTFGKDYIMYPLLKTNLLQKFGIQTRKIFAKKIGKKIPTIVAIFVLWLIIGIWHGVSFKYIFAAGILPWIYLTVSELFSFIPEKIIKIFNIKTDCFSYKLFQIIRTFLLMCFIWLFVCSPTLGEMKSVIRYIFVFADLNLMDNFPRFDAIYMLLFVFLVDYLNYKGIDAFQKLEQQNIIFKYLVVFFFITVILLYGCYGPHYNAANFIYGGF